MKDVLALVLLIFPPEFTIDPPIALPDPPVLASPPRPPFLPFPPVALPELVVPPFVTPESIQMIRLVLSRRDALMETDWS